ncbi:MAG: hypothetical protein B7733_21765 [Myxococcales bacterium FL481]|nr:MAG: hypothetical protein B7733_21765 [Myxococcales bacterium FL481]
MSESTDMEHAGDVGPVLRAMSAISRRAGVSPVVSWVSCRGAIKSMNGAVEYGKAIRAGWGRQPPLRVLGLVIPLLAFAEVARCVHSKRHAQL